MFNKVPILAHSFYFHLLHIVSVSLTHQALTFKSKPKSFQHAGDINTFLVTQDQVLSKFQLQN